MVVRRGRQEFEHHRFSDLPDLLPRATTLVANDSAVFPARLRARRATGGKVEILVLELGPEEVPAMFRAGKGLSAGEVLRVTDADGAAVAAALEVVGSPQGGRCRLRVREPAGATIRSLLDRHGEVPLPPYIRRGEAAGPEDRERYQTIYAERPGSVAAPTAGLHFSPQVMAAIRLKGHEFLTITLDVGPGTFQPVRGEIDAHRMEEERFVIGEEAASSLAAARRAGRPLLAVGTTTVRALESAAAAGGIDRPQAGATDLFIRPGHRFAAVDALVTNFHLPGSTLLALVQAFAGETCVRQAYDEAVARRYRFYSYGDAMLIL
jgi:S-adenosylmethionine:tRNA ribosyltransferase-isomerase